MTKRAPADPFAPMVEAARAAWSRELRNGAEFDQLMRRALAAAIRAAPCTDEMMKAWFSQHPLLPSGYEQVWRAMADALAAEMGGGR